MWCGFVKSPVFERQRRDKIERVCVRVLNVLLMRARRHYRVCVSGGVAFNLTFMPLCVFETRCTHIKFCRFYSRHTFLNDSTALISKLSFYL